MRLIAVTGYGRSGKDTVGKILVEQGYARLGMSDVLREACIALNPIVDTVHGHLTYKMALDYFGYEKAKDMLPEFRAFMERLGTEFAESIGNPALWIDTLLRDAPEAVVMTSCRRRVEAEHVMAHGGTVWRVTRPGYGPVSTHPVEREMDDWNFDVRIENDGTEADLAIKTLAMLDIVEDMARFDAMKEAAGNSPVHQRFPCVSEE